MAANNGKTRRRSTIDRCRASYFAMGWNGALARQPYCYDLPAIGQPSYEAGRLFAAEAIAKSLPVKPWKMRGGKLGMVQFPRHIRDASIFLHDVIPPQHTGA